VLQQRAALLSGSLSEDGDAKISSLMNELTSLKDRDNFAARAAAIAEGANLSEEAKKRVQLLVSQFEALDLASQKDQPLEEQPSAQEERPSTVQNAAEDSGSLEAPSVSESVAEKQRIIAEKVQQLEAAGKLSAEGKARIDAAMNQLQANALQENENRCDDAGAGLRQKREMFEKQLHDLEESGKLSEEGRVKIEGLIGQLRNAEKRVALAAQPTQPVQHPAEQHKKKESLDHVIEDHVLDTTPAETVEENPLPTDNLSMDFALLKTQVEDSNLSEHGGARIGMLMAQLTELQAARTSLLSESRPQNVPAVCEQQWQAMLDLQQSIEEDKVPDPYKLAALNDLRESLGLASSTAPLNKQLPREITNTADTAAKMMAALEQGQGQLSQLEKMQTDLLHLRAQIVAEAMTEGDA